MPKQSTKRKYIIFLGICSALVLSIYVYGIINARVRHITELAKNCNGKQVRNYKCVEPFITKVIQTEGLTAGFKMIKAWYVYTPEIRPYCDALSRYVGSAVEKKIPDYKTLKYEEESVWCNYGFYHGYMEAYMAETKDIKKGAEFCKYIGNELGTSAPGAQSECFRALGYAITSITASKEKDIQSIARDSIKICSEQAEKSLDIRLCGEGIFSELGRIVAGGGHGNVPLSNPLWICDQQKPEIKMLCYGTMKWLPFITLGVQQDDVSTGYKKIQKVYTEKQMESPALKETIGQVLFTLAYNDGLRSTALASNEGYEKQIKLCQSISESYLDQCIRGFAFGLGKGGVPGEQYHQVIDFCKKTSEIPGFPIKNCPLSAIEYLGRYYPPDLYKKMCKEVIKTLGSVCK